MLKFLEKMFQYCSSIYLTICNFSDVKYLKYNINFDEWLRIHNYCVFSLLMADTQLLEIIDGYRTRTVCILCEFLTIIGPKIIFK